MTSRKTSNLAEAFINLLVASEPGGIERQERMGTAALARSSSEVPAQLPKNMGSNGRAILEACGMVFGKDIDDLFIQATLPEGWSIKASDHRLYSHILDTAGRERAEIFYKDSSYDRSADLRVRCRYTIGSSTAVNADGQAVKYGTDEHTHYQIAILDAKQVSEVIDLTPVEGTATRGLHEAACDRARAVLAERFPNWQDPAAYWD
jgi:hypothetical protein